MAQIYSLSLLLAGKGISKLLWQMLALSPRCPAQHWILAHAQQWTYRSDHRTAETVVHRFRLGKMAVLILAGAEDDVIIMVLTHTASQKNWFLLSTPCQRHKKEGELTSLIYGPRVNDDTPSTPFHTVPVHDTSISINSHHPSECSHSPLGTPTWLRAQCNGKIDVFSAFQQLCFVWNAGGWCETFNWIAFWIGVYQSIGMGPKSGRLQWLQLCFMSFILLPLDTISLPPSQSLLCKSVSGYKMQVFLWHHTFLSYLPTLECWHIAEKKTLDLWLSLTNISGTNIISFFKSWCSQIWSYAFLWMSKASLNSLHQV